MNFVSLTRQLGLALAIGAIAGTAGAQVYDGAWEGVLTAGGPRLHLVLHVKTTGGATTAVLDSVDQNASIPASAVKTDAGQLDILFLPIMGELKSKLSPDGQILTGTWSQGKDLPLVLTKKPTATAH